MKLNKYIRSLLSVALLAVLMLSAAVVVSAADDFVPPDYISSASTKIFVNEEQKFADMGKLVDGKYTAHYEDDNYEIRADENSGEVGILVKATGQILLTNPYDVPSLAETASEEVREKLMSQIVLQYKDGSGTLGTLTSYADAACNGENIKGKSVNQIKVKQTRNGIRVEYTIGKEQAKYIVPKQIQKESFERNILAEWKDTSARTYSQIIAYYTLKNAKAKNISSKERDSMLLQFPITEKYAIYVLDPGITNRELEVLQTAIKENTDYDENQMMADYELIEYVDTSAAPALFRVAIEYSIDEHGIEITMPANSIKFDSSNYSIQNIQLLPYFCAGSTENDGFTLLPDGSGTITRFKDVADKEFMLTGKLYGKDYSFHTISGYTQEIMRIPAFGIMETAPFVPTPVEETEETEGAEGTESTEEAETTPADGEETVEDEAAEETEEIIPEDEETAELEYRTRGFVAYFTEGDSLAEFSSAHGGITHKYNSVYATFYPQTTDKYSLTGISSSGDAQWTITSQRKYIGNYTMRVFPIYGEGADYTDMAQAVREYLVDTGVLTKLDESKDASKDVPLYLENFGTVKTSEKFLGFPIKRQTALTTFDQTKGMLEELKGKGITNVNVRLTGWYNGGLTHTAPSTLKIPSSVGGEDGLKELVEFAKKNGSTIYPDLDFSYVGEFSTFDGLSVKKDTAKTIDNRSASHRIYNPLYQGFEADDKALITTASILDMYEKIEEEFKGYGTGAVSVGLLGYDLNSDHNDDYPLNRDDSQKLVKNFLAAVEKSNGKVMLDGGNAYAIKYADHILNVPLDSSMNINTSMSVPFMGMILHGYTEFSGTPINLDGDYAYSVLKAIENGAGLYYMVSKDNTSELKAFPEFSKYYAVR